ncbi:hypothetical protein COU60_03140 [Candidatus Pacearchaeota archaeon CG10_big_fil_rev_8_21_14_0_10_34_76]|nr:MAG: hypothetical protein COU60_03140 [Candidatus Pacearchaeota archaeon CG10_big_fil_rev_8_21_14_0_10_34_76]
MNKGGFGLELIIVFGVIALIGGGFLINTTNLQFAPEVGSAQKYCTDSDDGINFFEKGTTCVGKNCLSDSCINDFDLLEYYCDKGRKDITEACEGGCFSGKCLSDCNDGIDNDGDRWIDYDNDPQCGSLGDNNESADYIRLANLTDQINLGDALNGPFGNKINKENLPVVLSDKIYIDNRNNRYGYEQSIILGNPILSHFRDSDYEEQNGLSGRTPTLGVKILPHEYVLNYTLSFFNESKSNIVEERLIDLENTQIEIMGKNYLLVKATLSEFVFLDSNGNVTHLMNGENIRVNYNSIENFKSYINMEVNDSTAFLSKIILEWSTSDELFVTDISFVEMPFSGIRFYMNGFVTPVQERLEVLSDGNSSIKLKAFIADGLAEFNIIYANSTGEFIGLGRNENERLVTSDSNFLTFNLTSGDKWFITSWNSSDNNATESYLLTIESENLQNNSVSISNYITGDIECNEKRVGDSCQIGNIEFGIEEIVMENENKLVTFRLIGEELSFDELYTAEGLYVQLPYLTNSNTNSPGALNLKGNMDGHNPDSFYLFLTEESKDERVTEGLSFNITVDDTPDGKIHVSHVNNAINGGPSGREINSTKIYESYIVSDLATRILHYTASEQDSVELFYHGAESYANIYLHGPSTMCSNGLDDDFDGLIDGYDKICKTGKQDSENTLSVEQICAYGFCDVKTECNDGIDNDGDGWIDYGNDPQCNIFNDKESAEFARLDRTSDRLNIGDDLAGVFGQTIDRADFKKVLDEEFYFSHREWERYSYEQSLKLGSELILLNFSDLDYDNGEHTIGIPINVEQHIFNYTLNFLYEPESAIVGEHLVDFENTNITLFGKRYNITDAEINPLRFSLQRGNDTFILSQGNPVELNGEIIEGLIFHIKIREQTQNSIKLDKFDIIWNADKKLFITDDDYIEMPGFKTFRFYMNGFGELDWDGKPYAKVYLHSYSTRCSNELDDDFDGEIDGNDSECNEGNDDSEKN